MAEVKHARTVLCPKCKAEVGVKCRNYKGVHCAPHADRMRAAADAAIAADLVAQVGPKQQRDLFGGA